MSDLPNTPNQPTPPPRQGVGRALPPPQQESASDPEGVSRPRESSSISNAALLDVIRSSSSLVVTRLDTLINEFKGYRKEQSAHVKSLNAMVKYYQRKQERYAKLEEDYYRAAIKFYLKSGGAEERVPASSSLYNRPEVQSVDDIVRERETRRTKKEKPLYSESWKDIFLSPFRLVDGLIRTTLRAVDVTVATASSTYQMVKSGLSRTADLVDSPLKLLDSLVASVISVPLTAARLGGYTAKKAGERVTARRDKEEQEERTTRYRDRYGAFPGPEAFEDELSEEERSELYKRMEESVPVELPSDLVFASVSIGTLSIGVLDIATEETLTPENNLLTFSATPQLLPLFAPESRETDRYSEFRNVSPDSFLQSGPYVSETQSRFASVAKPQGSFLAAPGPTPLLPPPEGSTFTSSNSSFISESVASDRRSETIDELDDVIFQKYFGDMSQFFAVPSSSEVGQFLKSLFGDREPPAGNQATQKIKLDLPPWLMFAATIIAVGILLVLGAISVGIVAIAAALSIGFLLLAVGVTAVLLVIAAAVFIVAALVGLLGITLIKFVGNTLDLVVKLLGGLVDIVLDFLSDPGAFFERLLTGIASGFTNAMNLVVGSLIDNIAKAFKEIPILKSISDLIDRVLSKTGDVYSKLADLAGTLINFVAKPLELISGFTQALVAILGATVVTTLARILSVVSGIISFIQAGGLNPFNNAKEQQQAKDAFAAGYSATTGMVVDMISTVAKYQKDAMVQEVLVKTKEAVKRYADLDLGRASNAPSPSGGSSGQQSQPQGNQTTIITSAPSFASIPLYGGGF